MFSDDQIKLIVVYIPNISASLLVTAVAGIASADEIVKNFSGMRPNVKAIEDALGEQKVKVRGVEKKVVGAASFDQITFDFNSANLTPEARQFLDVVGEALAGEKLKGFTYEVEGHTDAKGSEDYNMMLSERRAESVQKYLVSRARIDPARLVVTPVGESDLLYPQDPDNPKNRRVVLRASLPPSDAHPQTGKHNAGGRLWQTFRDLAIALQSRFFGLINLLMSCHPVL